AAAGLFCLKNRKSCLLPDKIRLLEKRWLFPFPKCNEAQEIVKAGIATSMIDISDGLSSDLFHILEESGVGAEVWEDSLPVLSEVKTLSEVAGISYMDFVLNGGEDYQLLFTARGSEEPEKKLSFPVFEIGKIIEERGLFLVDKEGRKRKIKPGGWDHFPSKERKGK
ncbi:hypothetical protein H5U35_02145, partial [Candidatus Aerophobetes bacterium]|nr:hypothetical protein [Candidatus Aerophobetes bacterium]